MKFAVTRANLNAAITKVANIIEKRNTIPILTHILIEADRDGLRLSSTDLDIHATVTVSAQTERDGVIALDGATLRDIVRKLAEGADVTIEREQDGPQAVLRAGRSRFKLNHLPPEDFPKLTKSWPAPFKLAAPQLASALAKTSFAISTEETRYYLNGIYVHIQDAPDGRKLRFVATDGHRLAMLQIAAPAEAANFPGVILPRKTAAELAKLLSGAEGDVEISEADKMLRFAIGDVVLVSKTIDGTFPDYQRIMPKNPNSARLSREETIEAIERVSTVASERSGAVKFSFDSDKLALSAKNEANGESHDEVEVLAFDADPIDIGFNGKYMTEALNAFDCDSVTVKLNTPGDPTLLHAAEDANSFAVVIMPLRV